MSYPKFVKDFAFTLLSGGMSANAVARAVYEKFEMKISPKTVRGWENSKEYKSALKIISERNFQRTLDTAEKLHQEAIEDIKEIKKDLRSALDNAEAKTKEGVAYAWMKFQDRLLALTKDGAHIRLTDNELITLYNETLYEIPAVKEVLLKHKEAIEAKFQEKAKKYKENVFQGKSK